MGREEGGGFRMGSTGIPVVDSFRCLAKLIQYCKVWKKKKKEVVAVVQSLSRVRLFYDPVDCRPPGSSDHGISQARI